MKMMPLCQILSNIIVDHVRRDYREGNGSLLQYSCLENSIGIGACWATVHVVTKYWTQLRD